MSVVVSGERAGEKFAGVRLRVARDLLGRAGGDDFAALVAAFGAEIDEPVGGFDDVEIVFDDDERRAGFEQFAERGEEFGDVVEMQTGGGLVEDVEDLFIFGAREMRGEFQTLGFAAGERCCGLAETQIAEADFVEHAKFGDNFRHVRRKMCSASRTVICRTS